MDLNPYELEAETEKPDLPGSVIVRDTVDDVIDVLCADMFIQAKSCVRGFGGEVHEVQTGATVLRFDLNPIPKDDTCHSKIYRQSAWSPDSRQLAVHDFGPGPDYAPGLLHIREIATGGDTTVSVTTASFLQFSPDSAHLLFSGPGGIWLVDADGTDLTFLAEGSQPAWQPQP